MRFHLRSRLHRAAKRVLEPSPLTIHEQYPQYEIGRGTYGKPNVLDWGSGTTLRIGAFCSIAADVHIFLGGDHRVDWATTFPFGAFWPEAQGIEGHPTSRGDVTIGNDVWIARSAMIMSGVSIGDGAVVGARAVVSRDIPAYSIAAGNPAQVVRKRFDDQTVARFLAIRWWNWPDAVIADHLHLLMSDDVEAFLDAAEALA